MDIKKHTYLFYPNENNIVGENIFHKHLLHAIKAYNDLEGFLKLGKPTISISKRWNYFWYIKHTWVYFKSNSEQYC